MTEIDMVRKAAVRAIVAATKTIDDETDPNIRVHHMSARLALIFFREALDEVITEEMPR